MILDKTGTRRLAFIRFLFNHAVGQSKKSEPLSSASLLTFHDAIELFFGLSCEHLEVTGSREKTYFNEYWDLIAGGLNGTRLTQEASIKRLNKARVALKHQGTLPSKLDVEAFRVNATNFFEENTPIVFGIQLYDVSLIELVQYEKARDYLKEAERVLKENEREDALDNVACAFEQLIRDYESTKIGEFGRSPFFFGRDMTFLSSFFLGFHRPMAGSGFDRDGMGEFVDKVKESLLSLQGAVKILSLGIDYRRYIKFKLLTPYVSFDEHGEWAINREMRGSKGIPTEEDVQFCIDFVIESAISLQELDFTLEGAR